MLGRILMATVATLALTVPAVAQDQAKPPDTGQTASPPVQMEQNLQQQGAGESATGQAPAQAQPSSEPPAPEPSMTEDQPAGQPAEEMAEEGAEGKAAPEQMSFMTVQDDAQILASDELIGSEVHNINDEKVGSIADLVMDQDHKLAGVVLSVGGFLGVGDKWVAVPVDQIELPKGDQPARLMVAVSVEQLESAPDFITKAAAQQQSTMQQQQVPAPASPPAQ
jgi:sporulation protein YlmC with PRC-barrel domain